MRYLVAIFLLTASVKGWSQELDLSVPDTIRKELNNKVIQLDSVTRIMYKMVFPKNFDPAKKYPVFMGLSGGLATSTVVDYCYYTMFRSELLDGYIKILPVAPEGKSLRDVGPSWIKRFINALPHYELATDDKWIIAGTSNGGVAAFNFAQNKPDVFNKLVVMPGVLGVPKAKDLPKEWSSYKMVLAVGSEDSPEWKQGVDKSFKILKTLMFQSNPEHIKKVVMQGQGHIVKPGYDIDQVYKVLFGM